MDKDLTRNNRNSDSMDTLTGELRDLDPKEQLRERGLRQETDPEILPVSSYEDDDTVGDEDVDDDEDDDVDEDLDTDADDDMDDDEIDEKDLVIGDEDDLLEEDDEDEEDDV